MPTSPTMRRSLRETINRVRFSEAKMSPVPGQIKSPNSTFIVGSPRTPQLTVADYRTTRESNEWARTPVRSPDSDIFRLDDSPMVTSQLKSRSKSCGNFHLYRTKSKEIDELRTASFESMPDIELPRPRFKYMRSVSHEHIQRKNTNTTSRSRTKVSGLSRSHSSQYDGCRDRTCIDLLCRTHSDADKMSNDSSYFSFCPVNSNGAWHLSPPSHHRTYMYPSSLIRHSPTAISDFNNTSGLVSRRLDYSRNGQGSKTGCSIHEKPNSGSQFIQPYTVSLRNRTPSSRRIKLRRYLSAEKKLADDSGLERRVSEDCLFDLDL